MRLAVFLAQLSRRATHGLGLALLAAAHAAVVAAPARAQPATTASITGAVKSDGEQPLADAEVRISGAERSARTSPGGIYRIDSLAAGRYLVQVRRLGYVPVYYAVTLKPGESREVDVELSRLPQRLSAVKVRERSGYGLRDEGRMSSFQRRMRSSATSSRFLTRDDLAARHRGAGTLFDALRAEWPLTGCTAIVGPRPMGAAELLRAARGGRSGCRLAVSLDGAPPTSAEAVVDYPMHLVEAVEIYRAGVGMPIEFEGSVARNADVIVVVWTGVDSDW